MSEEKLLTVRDVSALLGISEKEVVDLAENGSLPAYKVGGVYLRFKSDQVQQFRKVKNTGLHRDEAGAHKSAGGGLGDFLYFNDFYIVSLIVVAALLYIIFQGH
ncbi:MAG: helix-turn-helix domain-containing protein [Candidatus Omnitrophica bacterium]|nr:helix-turn-helix domain-containing protein [Candidatus Omnitrophota bacterium]